MARPSLRQPVERFGRRFLARGLLNIFQRFLRTFWRISAREKRSDRFLLRNFLRSGRDRDRGGGLRIPSSEPACVCVCVSVCVGARARARVRVGVCVCVCRESV